MLKSFEEFSQFRAEQAAAELTAKQTRLREETTAGFKQLLAEYGVSKLSELNKEQKIEFFTKLDGEPVTESRRTMSELKQALKTAKEELGLLMQQYKLNKTETNLARVEAKKGKVDRIMNAMQNAKEEMKESTVTAISEASIKAIQMLLQNKGIKDAVRKEKADTVRKAMEAEDIDTTNISDDELLQIAKELMNESINENFEVHYSDGVRAMKKFSDKNKAIAFMQDKIENNKNLKEIAVYKAGSNFHSTADVDAVVAWWGDGSYLDNVSKKDSTLAGKKINESVNEAEVKTDEEFKEYAFTVLKKAFGKDFDEAKADEVVSGILSKVDGDYGSAVGMLQASLS
jgi:hypothetical protein